MQLGLRQRWKTAGLATATALVTLLAERALGVATGAYGAPWPGLALLTGLLLGWGQRRIARLALAGGSLVGLIAASLLKGQTLSFTMLHALATIGAALIARWGAGAFGPAQPLLDDGPGLRRFVRAAIAASFIPGLVEAWRNGWQHGITDLLAVALFILLVTPFVCSAARAIFDPAKRPRPAGVRNAAPWLLAGIGTAVLAFWSPLPFLALGIVIVAVLRWQSTGAVLMTAMIAIVASSHTETSLAPLLTQQALLACCFAAGLPFALLLNRWRSEANWTQQLSAVIDNNGDVLFLLDAQGRWSFLNPTWQSLSGQPVEAALGHSWLDQVALEDREGLERQAATVLAGEAPSFRHTLRFQTPAGLRWVELSLKAITDAQGRPAGAAGSLRDVDERKRLEEHTLTARRVAEQRAREATLLASTDELTGIANRRAFLHQLDREIEAAIDYGWPLAVALFDVDHFKAVNDRFGHAVGDRVLQHISARAVASVRGGDLVGRLGGEEFGILMPGSSAAEAAIVAERLRRAVQAASVEGQALPSVTVSIGIAQREDHRVAEALLAIADRALYLAKDEGRNRIRIAA